MSTMHTERRRLGRGLSSLIGSPVAVEVKGAGAAGLVAIDGGSAGEVAAATTNERAAVQAVPAASADALGEGHSRRLVMIPVGRIVSSPFQPRRAIDEKELKELAASITAAGMMQPVVVRLLRSGGAADVQKFELIAGERRWRAARVAGLKEIPAVVVEVGDEQAAEWGLIENVQRVDLDALEKGHALRRMCEQFGLTHEQAAARCGLDRATVTNLIRMTDLEPEIQKWMEQGRLSGSHGKVLLGVSGGEARMTLARRAAEGEWSVRRLEAAIREQGGAGAARDPAAAEKQAKRRLHIMHLEKELGEHLGTEVKIRVTDEATGTGTLAVRFYNLDHFDGLMGKMGFVMKS